MELGYNNILVRAAVPGDASLLCAWWNDGRVMAHAGFPKGLNISTEKIAERIENEDDLVSRLHMIICDGIPVGEMNYRNIGNGICEIGIKICEEEFQNKGLGKTVLSMFIHGLFDKLGYEKVKLSTNPDNKRAVYVYEQLGFKRTGVFIDSWTDQLGNRQSSVEYELTENDFTSYMITADA